VAGDNELAWACEEFLEQVDQREHGEGAKLGLQTSLRAWNEVFGGIQPAQYYAIGGRPGAGKSALAEQFAQEQALAGVPVLYISAELRRDRVIARMAARQAEVNMAAFLRGGSRREERVKLREALAKLKAAKFWLINPSDITGGQIRSITRRLKRQMGIGLAVFDYLQLVQIPEGKERWEGIAAASVEIRKAVNETGVPFLTLVQLNREAERESRPRMGHIKEASQVEQDCDAVILLKALKEEQDPSGFYPITANVDKNRWGSTCEFNLMFHGRTLAFKNAAEKRETDFL
jgi:replicative DNA helicase